MLLRNQLTERSDPADQFFEQIVTSFQHHQQPCEEQPRVDAAFAVARVWSAFESAAFRRGAEQPEYKGG